jgi:hypothetical protein
MFNLSRMTAGFAVVALLTAACNTDSNGPSSSNRLSSLNLSADRNDNDDANGSNGSSSGFSVLANAAVTCTGGSIIGDVGTRQTAPPGAITVTEGCLINGASDIGGPAAVAAYNAFLAAYAALAPKTGDVCPIITGTLAGQSFSPGVYCVSAEAKTGVVTLNGPANGVWVFKVAPGAFTGTSFSVVLAGNAQACNVTWWVDAAATMTDSDLKGNVLAGAAITLTRGTFAGNAYAGAAGVGDVTSTGTAVVGCGGKGNGGGHEGEDKDKCNQGVGNGPEGCDPGNSNHRHGSNDEDGGRPGHPGRRGGH